jgi:hypothetical protein
VLCLGRTTWMRARQLLDHLSLRLDRRWGERRLVRLLLSRGWRRRLALDGVVDRLRAGDELRRWSRGRGRLVLLRTGVRGGRTGRRRRVGLFPREHPASSEDHPREWSRARGMRSGSLDRGRARGRGVPASQRERHLRCHALRLRSPAPRRSFLPELAAFCRPARFRTRQAPTPRVRCRHLRTILVRDHSRSAHCSRRRERDRVRRVRVHGHLRQLALLALPGADLRRFRRASGRRRQELGDRVRRSERGACRGGTPAVRFAALSSSKSG